MFCCSEYRDYFPMPEIMIKAVERPDAYEEIFELPAAMRTFVEQVPVQELDVATWHRIQKSKWMDLKPKPVDLKVPYNENNAAKALGDRWDHHRKIWVAPRSEPALLFRWGGYVKSEEETMFSSYWMKRAAAKGCGIDSMVATRPNHCPHMFCRNNEFN